MELISTDRGNYNLSKIEDIYRYLGIEVLKENGCSGRAFSLLETLYKRTKDAEALMEAMCEEYNTCNICRFRLVSQHTQFPCTQCKFGVKKGVYNKWQKIISDEDCYSVAKALAGKE